MNKEDALKEHKYYKLADLLEKTYETVTEVLETEDGTYKAMINCFSYRYTNINVISKWKNEDVKMMAELLRDIARLDLEKKEFIN